MIAVIFDMDGLMFDTERVFIEAWDYAGEQVGIGKAGFMTLKTLGLSGDACRQVWQKEFGDAYDEAKLRKYSRDYLMAYYAKQAVPVKKGLFNLIQFLLEQHYRLAVASSSSKKEVHQHLKDTGILNKFSSIVCGDMVKTSKPDPSIYLQAAKGLGVKPSACYALEDSKNGIIAACRAGCKVIMVPDLWQPDDETEEMLEAKFDDLNEVVAYLQLEKSFIEINQY